MNNKDSAILKLKSAQYKWWRKPLVIFNGRALPAELAILAMELSPGEDGAWINSRGTQSVVVDLISSSGLANGNYVTRRAPLPAVVSAALKQMSHAANEKRGCPDLVIWNEKENRIRLVEVKCPHWDRPTVEQERFLEAAQAAGIMAKIVEWEFREGAA